MERCPHCNCKDIGKIGNNQFYCWNCFMEFALVGDEIKIYHVDEDGSLVAWAPDSGSTADTPEPVAATAS